MIIKDFAEVIEAIHKEDSRYEKAAYYFVRQALDHTLKSVKKPKVERPGNHVSGPELLNGIRKFALDQFGPMAFMLLQQWGVRKCEDFGDIVFNLVEYGVLGKTENDSKSDFKGVYSFREAFVAPFVPENIPDRALSRSSKKRV